MWIASPLWESERGRSQLTRMCKCLQLNDCSWNLGLILSSFFKGYACQLLAEPGLLFSHFSAVIISKSRKSKLPPYYVFWDIRSLDTTVKSIDLWKTSLSFDPSLGLTGCLQVLASYKTVALLEVNKTLCWADVLTKQLWVASQRDIFLTSVF